MAASGQGTLATSFNQRWTHPMGRFQQHSTTILEHSPSFDGQSCVWRQGTDSRPCTMSGHPNASMTPRRRHHPMSQFQQLMTTALASRRRPSVADRLLEQRPTDYRPWSTTGRHHPSGACWREADAHDGQIESKSANVTADDTSPILHQLGWGLYVGQTAPDTPTHERRNIAGGKRHTTRHYITAKADRSALYHRRSPIPSTGILPILWHQAVLETC